MIYRSHMTENESLEQQAEISRQEREDDEQFFQQVFRKLNHRSAIRFEDLPDERGWIVKQGKIWALNAKFAR